MFSNYWNNEAKKTYQKRKEEVCLNNGLPPSSRISSQLKEKLFSHIPLAVSFYKDYVSDGGWRYHGQYGVRMPLLLSRRQSMPHPLFSLQNLALQLFECSKWLSGRRCPIPSKEVYNSKNARSCVYYAKSFPWLLAKICLYYSTHYHVGRAIKSFWRIISSLVRWISFEGGYVFCNPKKWDIPFKYTKLSSYCGQFL